MDTEKYILAIEETGKCARGQKEMIKFLRGKRLTQREAIIAACYDCQGYYADGVVDCESKLCPLYQYHPYNKNRNRMPGRSGNPDALKKALEARKQVKKEAVFKDRTRTVEQLMRNA